MKIAFLITGLGMGGAEKQVCDLADRFVEKGHRVMIVYLTGEAILRPHHDSIPVVGMAMEKTVWSFIRTYIRLRSLFLEFRPDILHSHMVHANLFARLLRLSLPLPRLICTAHNSNEGGWLRMLMYRLTDPFADFSTNVSEEAVEAFVRRKAVPAGRMIAVYNGIDTRHFRYDPSGRTVLRSREKLNENSRIILCVGRLEAQKDYPNMFRAFQILRSRYNDLHLWIVGEGTLRPRLEEMVHELEIGGDVVFLGQRRDIPALMSACDVFCLSSSYEGFGLVVAEAMACEKVVVATDCGGVKEVVGDAGFLSPPNDPQSLAQNLSQALSLDDTQRRQLGERARRRVDALFSLDAIAQRWLDFYHIHSSEHP